MFQFAAGSRRGTLIVSSFLAIAIVSGLSGSADAQDSRTKAMNVIRQCKANISRATIEINKRTLAIIATNVGIAANELALQQEKMKPLQQQNQGKILLLEVTLAGLKVTKNKLVKEKQDWERFKLNEQRSLASWEAYLRKLGG